MRGELVPHRGTRVKVSPGVQLRGGSGGALPFGGDVWSGLVKSLLLLLTPCFSPDSSEVAVAFLVFCISLPIILLHL